jgi:DNA-directed RNA polymerase specialized sigma24 family protein
VSARRRSNYSQKEVRQLVERYAELLAQKDTTPAGLRTVDRLLDVQRGMRALNERHRTVVFLHGILRMTQQAVAHRLGVSDWTISAWYADALSWLHFEMNGGLDY